MSYFVIRVQLHNENNYAEFHKAMEKRGFKRTITSSEGRTYHLPNGSYSFHGNATTQDLLSRVRAAAVEAGSPAQVVITTGPSTWEGLIAA